MKLGRRTRAGDRSRGVAVLEFTLSIVFLVPLMMAALDFGFYFYVGATAEEAARQGLQHALRLGAACTSPADCMPGGVLITAPASGSGAACLGGDAACYMNGPPLSMGTAVYTNVSCSCSTLPVDPTYTITVQVDFAPAVGTFKPLMPASTLSPNKVRYTATLTGN
jgi:hypothetical protein